MHRNANRQTEKEKWAAETVLRIFNHLDQPSEQEIEEEEDEVAYLNGTLSEINGVKIAPVDNHVLDERTRMCKECEATFRGSNAPQHFEKNCVSKEKRTIKAIKEVLLRNTMEDIPIANDNVEEVLNLGTQQDRRREATRLYEEIRQGWIKISMKIRLDVRKILEVYDAAGRDISRTSMSIIRMVSLMNETFRTAVGEMHVKDVAEDTYLLEQPGTSGMASKKDRAKTDEKQKTDTKTKQTESKEEKSEEGEGHRRKRSRDERSESKDRSHEEDEAHRRKSSKDNNERSKSSRSRENSRDTQPESKDDKREEDGGQRRKKDNPAKIKSSRDRESSRRN